MSADCLPAALAPSIPAAEGRSYVEKRVEWKLARWHEWSGDAADADLCVVDLGLMEILADPDGCSDRELFTTIQSILRWRIAMRFHEIIRRSQEVFA